ncbi:heparinase II/III family protein [Robiginitomaculum antarcticum]|uniref:heparinase II/III family protein n=1 Tax=Robiginitomaculum antarcticum TaxID=437507 RepID=UPI00036B8BE5|nr:heparinase II/III family protein [Robiginitomaculum antarcticum]
MSRRLPLISTLGRTLVYAAGHIMPQMARPASRLLRKEPFAAAPVYIPQGRRQRGEAIIRGDYSVGGQRIEIGVHGDPWTIPLPSLGFAKRIHDFSWLYDLAAAGAPSGGPKARELVARWMATYGKYNSFSWGSDLLTGRIIAIAACWSHLLDTDDDGAAARRGSFARQVGYLRKIRGRVPRGLPELLSAGALSLGGVMLADKTLMDKSLDHLDDLLDVQILGDGGHISRNPRAAQQCLHMLLLIESVLKARKDAPSRPMRRAMDRLAPALDFFTSADGNMAGFNGSGETPRRHLRELAKRSGVKARTFSYMPHSGYQRLERRGTVFIMDTGESPPRPYDRQAHLAALAFELSRPGGRLIVNCGFSELQPESWHAAMRETAAHSTLVIDNCSAGQLVSGGLIEKIYGPAIRVGIEGVSASRKEQAGGIWLEAGHDGYVDSTGLAHSRRIYMDDDGIDIRGEDSLYVPVGESPKVMGATYPYAIRFHIHPDVRASLSRDGSGAILILKNGEGWKFKTSGQALTLEKSVYLGRGAQPERCQQLIISANALSDNDGQDRSNRVLWTFRRIEDEGQKNADQAAADDVLE